MSNWTSSERRVAGRTVSRTRPKPTPQAPKPPAPGQPGWRTLVEIVSPVAVLTALLYYFGWVRTGEQAHQLGFDASVMGLSTTDYLLKSVNVLYVWIAGTLAVALVLHAVHRRAVPQLVAGVTGRRILLSIARILLFSWPVWVSLGIVAFAVPALRVVAIPLGLTLATLAALYGRSLYKTITGSDPWSPIGTVLALTFLALVLFWDTERVALLMGRAFASDIAARPDQFPAVTVYSEKSLEVEVPCVKTTSHDRLETAYRYKYSGLRLLQRSGDRYFLINECWTNQQGRLLIVREDSSIRLEFTGEPLNRQ